MQPHTFTPTPYHLTSGQAAARLGVCSKTLLRAVRRGALAPAYRTPGGYYRFHPDAVEAYARRLARGRRAVMGRGAGA